MGRIDADKGLIVLADAFRQLRESHPEASLKVFGGGDPALIHRMKTAAPGILAEDWIDEPRLSVELANAAALVLPSYHEGYPLSLLEACRAGCLIIATDVGAIKEVFEGKNFAAVIPAGNTNALAAAMKTVLECGDSQDAAKRNDAKWFFEEINSPASIRRNLQTAYGI